MTSIKKEKKNSSSQWQIKVELRVYRTIQMFPLRVFRVRLHIAMERCSLDQVHIADVGKRHNSSSHWIISADEFRAL